MASGCGCKEVYRFPHSTYPYCSCICSFLQQPSRGRDLELEGGVNACHVEYVYKF